MSFNLLLKRVNMHHERIEQLDHHLSQIIYLLKQPSKSSFSAFNFSKKYLYEKSWTLVIGTPKSGKTTFLQQAELNVIQGQTEDNTDCSTWFSQDGVFIEAPSLSLDNPEENIGIDHFIQAIKARRKKKPFDNILITLNMYAFIQEYSEYMVYLEALKEQLQKVLEPYLGEKINLYIVFTHMDKVAGFCDFFTEFSAQHTTHALGYVFDDYHSKAKLMEQHEKKYYRLLGRLHENLVTLLHKTRNNLTRYLIREFPQQLDSLRNIIRSSVATLSEINPSLLKVNGVFFTSACQSGICVDRISIPVSQSYQLTLSNHFPQAHRTQPYFIKGIIKTIAKDHYPEDTRFAKYPKEHTLLAYAGYGVLALALLGMSFGYYFSKQHLEAAESTLSHYQPIITPEPLTSMIPKLSYLAQARNSLNDMNTWFIPFRDLHKTKHWVNSQYDKALSQQFLPKLAHRMEEQLLNERNPALQYELLKAYLMLGEPQYLDKPFLKHWLHGYLQLSSSADLESSLLQPFPGIPLNQGVINQARAHLNALPPEHLIYILLKSTSPKFIPVNHLSNTFDSSVTKKGIPDFYTREEFEKQYTQTIPEKTQEILDESGFLNIGNMANNTAESDKTANPEFKANLIQKVQALYTADYAHWWQLFLYRAQPKSFSSYEEANDFFNALASKTSPLTEMLIFIQANTAPFEHPNVTQEIFNAQIAATLTDINTISPETLISPQVNALLADLHRYFTMTVKSPDRPVIAFKTVKQRFMNPTQQGALTMLFQLSQNAPDPAKQWLTQIAGNTWLLLLSEAKAHINQQWTNNLLPEYTQNIAGKFPVTMTAEQDITLDNFSHFFNRQGTLEAFFDEYLKPFLNTENAQWTLKKVNNFELSIRPEIITEFERANVIREMFFPKGVLATRFAMQTTELQPIIARVILSMNGQTLLASQASKNVAYFDWPSNNNQPVTMMVQSITGEKFDVSESGPWAFFKLLTHANIQPIKNDPRTLQLIFDLNGNGVQYLLRVSSPINPFMPEVLQAFMLPGTVIG